MTHPCSFSLHDLIRQVSPGVMKVDGLDIDIGVEGVLVEENLRSPHSGSRETVLEEYHDQHVRTPPAG